MTGTQMGLYLSVTNEVGCVGQIDTSATFPCVVSHLKSNLLITIMLPMVKFLVKLIDLQSSIPGLTRGERSIIG